MREYLDGLPLLLLLESDELAEPLHSIEDLQLSHILQLLDSVLLVSPLLELALLESSYMVKSSPYDLLLDQEVMIGREHSMEILSKLGLQEEHFENNFLLETAADVADDAGLERVSNRQFVGILAVC